MQNSTVNITKQRQDRKDAINRAIAVLKENNDYEFLKEQLKSHIEFDGVDLTSDKNIITYFISWDNLLADYAVDKKLESTVSYILYCLFTFAAEAIFYSKFNENSAFTNYFYYNEQKNNREHLVAYSAKFKEIGANNYGDTHITLKINYRSVCSDCGAKLSDDKKAEILDKNNNLNNSAFNHSRDEEINLHVSTLGQYEEKYIEFYNSTPRSQRDYCKSPIYVGVTSNSNFASDYIELHDFKKSFILELINKQWLKSNGYER